MSRLIEFYRSKSPDARGRMLSDLWSLTDLQMESVHDFIQWMFPLREPSRYNPDAPLLTDADVAAFRSDPEIHDALRRSFGRFLAFLGLSFQRGEVVAASDFSRKSEVWRFPNHNWLRITRVLASLRILGLYEESRAFFEFLKAQRTRSTEIDAETFGYWERAAEG
ncbi:opioid growth factor receptor-related protein [Tundrisphaera lichenicola]|uniref:opioid growth factor receptor-related protein n=1 Tax=Tundrisphaera lichenicola TaxID=2029860 RepID=UPI003EBFF13C